MHMIIAQGRLDAIRTMAPSSEERNSMAIIAHQAATCPERNQLSLKVCGKGVYVIQTSFFCISTKVPLRWNYLHSWPFEILRPLTTDRFLLLFHSSTLSSSGFFFACHNWFLKTSNFPIISIQKHAFPHTFSNDIFLQKKALLHLT